MTAAKTAIDEAASSDRPPLAALRRLVTSLIEVSAEHRLDLLGGVAAGNEASDLGAALEPLIDRIRRAADLEPGLPADWLHEGGSHFVYACLEKGAGGDDSRAEPEALLHALTEPLDQGLVILDPTGTLLSINPQAKSLLAAHEAVEPGWRLTAPRAGAVYEDGSPCPAAAYPLDVAVRTGERQPNSIRGHLGREEAITWVEVDAVPLRRPGTASAYGVLGVLSDVTAEKDWERRHLRPAGWASAKRELPLDIVRVLDEIPPHLFPEQFVSEARRITGSPIALYVLDIDGTHLLRLAGAEEFPARLDAPLALGPELARDGIAELRGRIEAELPGVVVAPMWLRGRAIGLLLALRASEEPLLELARHGAAALELARGYTDVVDAARRRKETHAAAELQQSLVPPRIARIGGGELAGGVLPSYEVGGDWFDYVENRDGAWIAIADAAGKGATAGALGGIALAALRAARRDGQSLEAAVQSMHEVVYDVGRPEFFVTAIVARWHAVYSSVSWVNCGHPPPLVIRADESVEQLPVDHTLPLGLFERERRFIRRQRRLEDGERLILHSDGITARRTEEGLFGLDGIQRAIRRAPSGSATAMAKAIQEAVMGASKDPLQDDAVVVVLAPDRLSRTP